MNNIGPQLHEDRPRVVAFGSGKGGTGKSTLCADIARALTRHNFRVLCIDAAWQCPTLNILLGCDEPTFDFRNTDRVGLGDPEAHIAEFIVPTAYADVYLASIAAARRHPFAPPSIHPDEFLHQLHELNFDWVLIDMSSGIDPLNIGLFTLSDIPVLVTSPEPAAVRTATQFLRAALFRAIGYHPDARSVEGEILDILYKQPLRMNTRELRYDAPSADSRTIIDETIQRLETYMIVNLVREGAEHDLGFVLSHAMHRELQTFPRVLASVDYADRRWFYNRRTTGVDSSRSEDGLPNDIEVMARNIRDIALVDMRYPRPVPLQEEVHPAMRMGLNPELSRNEVRQYCRRLWEGYRRETAISLVFTDPAKRMETADELEILYRQVLTMPSESFSASDVEEASRRYNQIPRAPVARPAPSAPAPDSPQKTRSSEGTKSEEESGTPAPTPSKTSSEAGPKGESPSPEAKKSSPERSSASAKSPGQTLSRLRRQQAMSLQELSSRTHIGVKFLAAIEDVDLDVLPRQVYLRGYLREIARVFDVDPQQLVADYFRYLEDS